ncbi:MAG: cadmium-translocating P-type ATPase, partial [Oricola sp.]|nr:cadmium-translocating P-type ATPase [Oricola sp.]
LSASVWSLYTVFSSDHTVTATGIWQALVGSDAIYFEVAAGVTVFVLAGRYFEARAKSKAGSALRALAELSAKDVTLLLADGSELVIPTDELAEQHRFVVRPGQTIAADGLVVDGSAAVDMSAMTGEAKPQRVHPGGQVIGGTIVLDGRLVVEAAAVGADTRFAGMVRLVEEAQAQKADAQRLADRVSAVFVPCVFVIAALTAVGWLLAGGGANQAVSAALAVLVIACPCALGLATPTAMMVASGRGAQLGIFLKGHRALEATRAVDTVVFDKTGTLTTGTPRIADASIAATDIPAAKALAEHSIHPASRAIAAYFGGSPVADLSQIKEVPGFGVEGVLDGKRVRLGRIDWANEITNTAGNAVTGSGLAFAREGGAVSGFVLSEALRPEAVEAVAALGENGMGLEVLSGDAAPAVEAIARRTGIDNYRAGVTPAGKIARIKALQSEGHRVLMVGDGLNDAPALAAGHVSMAPASASDIGRMAADFVFTRDTMLSVPFARDISVKAGQLVRQNFGLAILYNIIAVPLAVAGFVTPLIAALAMSGSSIVVVTNSMRLARGGRLLPSLKRHKETAEEGREVVA